ncbi:MAG: serine protease [Candidatus Pelagibacter sp.]|nr:serine protease [Candidatus Pelagibacter sp.]
MKRFVSIIIIFFIFQSIHEIAYSIDVSKGFSKLAEKSMPSVVNISATTVVETRSRQFPFQVPPGSPFEDFFKEFEKNQGPQKRRSTALGSGFVIKESGIVITNNHVIQNAEGIFVKFTDGKEYEAKLVGTDPVSDIAVLKIKSDKKFPAVKFGDSNKARVGDWVLAIGNPFGLGGTVTQGIISAINRDINMGRYDNFIQTDASINQGNSGGPLFNMNGEVMGINTAIYSNSGGSVGIGFAIPANFAKNVIEQLIKYGETKRGWLGVRIQTVTKEIAESLGLKEAVGALVTDVNPDSPADKAGLKPGDIIIVFNGKKVKSMRDLPRLVGEAPVGKAASVKIWRNKKEILKTVILGRLENTAEFKQKIPKKTSEQQVKSLGIDVRDIEEDDRKMRNKLEKKTGVIIKKIDPNGAMALLPIRPGDAIISLQNNSVKNVKDFDKKLNKIIKSGKKTILLTIIDIQNTTRYIGVKIK